MTGLIWIGSITCLALITVVWIGMKLKKISDSRMDGHGKTAGQRLEGQDIESLRLGHLFSSGWIHASPSVWTWNIRRGLAGRPEFIQLRERVGLEQFYHTSESSNTEVKSGAENMQSLKRSELHAFFRRVARSTEEYMEKWGGRLWSWDMGEEYILNLDIGDGISVHFAYDPVNFRKDQVQMVFNLEVHPEIAAGIAAIAGRHLPFGIELNVNPPYFYYENRRWEGEEADIKFEQKKFDEAADILLEAEEVKENSDENIH